MTRFRFALVLGSIAAWMNFTPLWGAEFRLSVTDVDAQGRPTLSLSGLTTGQYRLEASTNLNQWYSLTSAPAATGPVSFTHTEAAQLGAVFYRGHQLPDVSAIVPQVDSNYFASGLITMETGGRLVLTNDGVIYSFTVGPSNVVDPVAVRMQLVTNLNSFPYLNEMRTAVLFEPSGFEFHGAGLLEITFPTNIPSLKISSFAFDGDGRGLHLTPDVISSNRVQIPVTHFSGVGTGLWAPSARTAAITALIENAGDRAANDLAGILGTERDRELSGEQPRNLNTEITSRFQDYYDNFLKPFFTEAETDCALAQTLTQKLLGMDRQSQLLGYTNGPASSFLGSETYKKWNCNCMAEAIKACEEGKISDKTLVRTLIGFERQSRLLGDDSAMEACGLGSLDSFLDQALNKKLPCAPDWIGVVSYSDGGSRTWDCAVSPGMTCTASSSASLSFEADVERATMVDESFPPFFTKQTWNLKFFPQASGSITRNTQSEVPKPCGGVITIATQHSGAGTGPLDLEVEFVFEDGELTDFVIQTVVNGVLAVKTMETTQTVLGPCEDGTGGSSSSKTSEGTTFFDPAGVSFDEVTFTKRTTTALQGTVRGTREGLNGIVMPYSWSFSLRRNGP